MSAAELFTTVGPDGRLQLPLPEMTAHRVDMAKRVGHEMCFRLDKVAAAANGEEARRHCSAQIVIEHAGFSSPKWSPAPRRTCPKCRRRWPPDET